MTIKVGTNMATKDEPIVSIHWSANDLMEAYSMNEDDAAQTLVVIGKLLEQRSIEVGWSILDQIMEEVESG
jgi:citrate lyase beta subunit